MNKVICTVETRIQELKMVIEKKERAQKTAPPGRVDICGKGFYHVTKSCPRGRYLGTSEGELLKQLAQKSYDKKVLRLAEAELKCLESGRIYTGEVYEDIYEHLDPRRQALVVPAVKTKEMLEQAWKSRPYKRKGFRENEPRYLADDNLYVRSRAELFCVSLFNKYGIAFMYEYPVRLKNGMLVYPDFCIMDSETGGDKFFEYFGMMDNPEYAEAAAKKLNGLAMAGIVTGKNLTVAMETSKEPMNTQTLEIIIRENFAPKTDRTV